MDTLTKQDFIRKKATENQDDPRGEKIYWSRHATAELVNDVLDRTDVEIALQRCEVIEDYPAGHRPLPDCLVLAVLASGIPIHVVVAVDEANDRIFVVTAYVPSSDRWQDDWRTRR